MRKQTHFLSNLRTILVVATSEKSRQNSPITAFLYILNKATGLSIWQRLAEHGVRQPGRDGDAAAGKDCT